MQILARGRSEKGHVAERLVDMPELPMQGRFLCLVSFGAPSTAQATRVTPPNGEKPAICDFEFLTVHLQSMLESGWTLTA